jgi:hypothetical protein
MHSIDLSIRSDSEEGLFSPDDLDGVQLGEVLTEPRQLDLVALHPSQLTAVVVAPPIDGEVVAEGNYPLFRIPIYIPHTKRDTIL